MVWHKVCITGERDPKHQQKHKAIPKTGHSPPSGCTLRSCPGKSQVGLATNENPAGGQHQMEIWPVLLVSLFLLHLQGQRYSPPPCISKRNYLEPRPRTLENVVLLTHTIFCISSNCSFSQSGLVVPICCFRWPLGQPKVYFLTCKPPCPVFMQELNYQHWG